MRKLRESCSSSLRTVLCCALAISTVPATGQEAPSTSDSGADLDRRTVDMSEGVAEIIVTGRKREELLSSAPMSITAYSEQKLDQLDITSLTDIGKITPGFRFEQQAFQNGFRFLSQSRFRGVVALGPRPNTQVGATFIDGVYLPAGASSIGIDDVERIEVIKGPQNAYFGRNTFAGAVNFITKAPSATFKASANVKYQSYDGYEIGGHVEGPLVADTLAARVSVKTYQIGTGYDSGDGTDVGMQRTDSASLTLNWTPGDRLKIRLRTHYQRDSDYGNLIVNYSGNNASCRVGAQPFFCGAVPDFGETYTTVDGREFTPTERLIHQDTSLIPIALVEAGRPTALIDMLNNVNGVLNDVPFLEHIPKLDHFGSESRIFRTTSSWSYDLGHGFDLAGTLGYGDLRSAVLRDDDSVLGSVLPLDRTVFVYIPWRARDLTAEVRVNTPEDRRLRSTFGVSYYRQWLDGNLTGFGKSLIAGTGEVTAFNNNDRDRSYAVGVFGGLSYDIRHNLTLDLEGRYQRDESRQFVQTGFNTYREVNASFPDFLPRVILTWKPWLGTTIYGSYSLGALTGVANTNTNNLVERIAAYADNRLGTTDPAQIRRAIAEMLGITGDVLEVVPAEKMDHYELGYKQTLLNGRVAFSLAGYHIKWRNMKTTAVATVPDLDGDTLPDLLGPTIPATSRIYGVEFQVDARPLPGLELGLSGEIVDHKYTNYIIFGAAAQIISPTARVSGVGKTLPMYPESSFHLTARYTWPVLGNLDAYVGTEVSYTGKSWLDEGNQAYIGGYSITNLRTGLRNERFSTELFVTNLFDYDGLVGGRRNSLGDGTLGLTLYPAAKRVLGIRTSFHF